MSWRGPRLALGQAPGRARQIAPGMLALCAFGAALALGPFAGRALSARAEEPAFRAPLETVAEIEACVRQPLSAGTSVQWVTFRSRDRLGNEAWFDAKIYWKRVEDGFSRVLMSVTAPAVNAGTKLLLIQKQDHNDIFIYAPELKRVRRVTNRMISSSVLGTDFSYEDFERLQGLAKDGDTKRLPDGVIDGRPVYVIEARPESDPEVGSTYGRVRSHVDQESCVPLRVEYFEHGDEPRKVLVTRPEDMMIEAGRQLPRKTLMSDRQRRTSTEVVVKKLELGVPIRSGLFTTRNLEFGRN